MRHIMLKTEETYAHTVRQKMAARIDINRRIRWFKRWWWSAKDDFGETMAFLIATALILAAFVGVWILVNAVESRFR